MKRAYRTTWNGITFIVAARSASKARLQTHIAAHGAGYPVKWVDIRVTRAPEHDAWAAVDTTGCCWDESYLPKASVYEVATDQAHCLRQQYQLHA